MKKLILFFILASSFLTIELKACDICGCGVGSYYIGILPEFNKKIFGIRYQYKTLRTHIGAGGASTYLTTDESYRTAEIWGGWNIGKRFRVMGFVPFNFNERLNQGVTSNKNGIGDIAFTGFYQLLNHNKTIGNKLLVQSLWVGGGVKLPTGKYEPLEKKPGEESANIFQLGTKSLDFTLNAMYDIRIQDVGMNANVNYKINTANGYDYQYGNKFSGNVQAYYKIRVKNVVTIAPNTGVLYEAAQKDMDGKYASDVSGGYALTGTVGMEAAFRNISIGGNWQTPLSQNLANGFVKANNRMMLHLSFLL